MHFGATGRGRAGEPARPGTMEKTVTAYTTEAAYAALTAHPMDEIWLRYKNDPQDIKEIESISQDVAHLLSARGVNTIEIRIPPPGRHPHQSQMQTILFLLMGFAFSTLILSGVLSASVFSGWLERERRNTGILKTLGMTGARILYIDTMALLILATIALLPAIPLSIFAGGAWASKIGSLLNINLNSTASPLWVWIVQIGSALLVPLLTSLPVLYRYSKITVREAMTNGKQSAGSRMSPLVARALLSRKSYMRFTGFVVRNIIRRPGRTLLAMALLSLGIGFFSSSMNLSEAWRTTVVRNFAARLYDVEIWLQPSIADQKIISALSPMGDRVRMEKWGKSSAAWETAGYYPVSNVYPDQGHGSLTLWGTPVNPQLMHFKVIDGKWLTPADRDAAVINQFALSQIPGLKIGDNFRVSTVGGVWEGRLAGVVQETGTPAAVYIPLEEWEESGLNRNGTIVLRVRSMDGANSNRTAFADSLEGLLDEAGLIPDWIYPITLHLNAMEEHVEILAKLLAAFAILIASVGILGLLSTLTLSVIERGREIGIMKALGATPERIRRLIIAEGVMIAFFSWIMGSLLSVPFGREIGWLIGQISFRMPLEPTFIPLVLYATLPVVITGAILASWLPARRASLLSVREVLASQE